MCHFPEIVACVALIIASLKTCTVEPLYDYTWICDMAGTLVMAIATAATFPLMCYHRQHYNSNPCWSWLGLACEIRGK